MFEELGRVLRSGNLLWDHMCGKLSSDNKMANVYNLRDELHQKERLNPASKELIPGEIKVKSKVNPSINPNHHT